MADGHHNSSTDCLISAKFLYEESEWHADKNCHFR